MTGVPGREIVGIVRISVRVRDLLEEVERQEPQTAREHQMVMMKR